VMCSPPRATVTTSAPVTRVKNTNYSNKFTVKNNCSVGIDLDFSTSRTGAVATVGSGGSPATLAPGASLSRIVSYHTGSPGSGTVTLTANTDGGASSFGTLQVTVTN
jgi:hypothetical protein